MLRKKQDALRERCADHVETIVKLNEEMNSLWRQQKEVDPFCREPFSPADGVKEALGFSRGGALPDAGLSELVKPASLEWENDGLMILMPASVVAGLATLAIRKEPPPQHGPSVLRGPRISDDDFGWEVYAGIRIHPLLWMLRCDLRLRWKPQPVDGISDLCLHMMQRLQMYGVKTGRSSALGISGFLRWYDRKVTLTLEQMEGTCGFNHAGLAALVDICTDEDWAVAVRWMSKRSVEEWPGERFDDPAELGRWMRAVTPTSWRDPGLVKAVPTKP